MKVALALFLLACSIGTIAANDCAFIMDGKEYKFDKLTKSTPYNVMDGQQHYDYDFNVCGTLQGTKDPTKCSGTSAVCQYDHTQSDAFVSVCANWPISGTGSGWKIGAGTSNNEPVIELDLINGASGPGCGSGGIRATAIQFNCDPTTEAGTLSVLENPQVSCEYFITFPTKYACKANAVTPGGSGSSTGAWVFNGLLLAGIPFYFLVGCLFKWKKANGEGTWREWCPNYEFWMGLPGLMKDGALYFWHLCQSCFQKVTGGGASYETVE